MIPTLKDRQKGPSALSRAMTRFKAHRERQRGARIGFVIDATGSRSATWEEAQVIQARMFRALGRRRAMALRLVHFGGNRLTDHGWESDAAIIAARMAQTHCKSGVTQIVPALSLFADAAPEAQATAVILVGDCFEENADQVAALARALAAKNIRVFSFLEGADQTAESVFRLLAETTGGAFARFGTDLPLCDLCEGVALLTGGGKRAIRKLKNEKVKRLLLAGPSRK